MSKALDFFVRYAESQGALSEYGSDSTLLVLPSTLAGRLDLAEEIAVTADPDVAREDGGLLLAGGQPLLAQAADSVLADGDTGIATLAQPVGLPPDSQTLLGKAREDFPVDHGRIDASGGAVPGLFPLLRVGALVTYAASDSEHYQERIECWLDATARLALPDSVVERLAREEIRPESPT